MIFVLHKFYSANAINYTGQFWRMIQISSSSFLKLFNYNNWLIRVICFTNQVTLMVLYVFDWLKWTRVICLRMSLHQLVVFDSLNQIRLHWICCILTIKYWEWFVKKNCFIRVTTVICETYSFVRKTVVEILSYLSSAEQEASSFDCQHLL